MNYDIKDVTLAKKGKLRIEWADQSMPVLPIQSEVFRSKHACSAADSRSLCEGTTLEGGSSRGMSACHNRNGESGTNAESRRSRGRSVRLESSQHTG